MNNAGKEGISEGFRLAQSERAVPGGAGAESSATPFPAWPPFGGNSFRSFGNVTRWLGFLIRQDEGRAQRSILRCRHQQ